VGTTPPVVHLNQEMTHKTLQVPEVHCDHCKTSLEGAVGALGGVDMVEVSVPNATIDVTFDDDTVTLDTIKHAIEEQGYAVFG
jgi:copper chaperone